MASVSKVRISLRSDDLSNWESKNPVLNNGELAIVRDTNGNARFKIGDGTTAFKSLSYVNENELETDSAVVKSLAQGLKTKATPLGLAAGAFLSANADFSQALGYNAETKAADSYAFVWNGDAERALFDYYQSHGPGTFNINPADGLSGAYVGEQSLAEILGTKQDVLSADSDGNIYVTVAKVNGKVDRSDVQLSELKTAIAKAATLSTYTETKNELSNDGYLTAHQSLDNYYTKAQTSSDAEIAAQFSTLSTYAETKNELSNDGYLTAHQSLDSYYTKSETSSAAEISTDVDVLSAEISGKVCVGSILANEESEEGLPIIDVDAVQSLSVVHIDPAVYATMLSCEEVHPETVYFLDQENICAYDQKITDLADGTDAHDAVTLGQMNTAIGNINKILEELN